MYRAIHSIRSDSAVTLSILLGLSATLAEGYFRTDLGDAESDTKAAYAATNDLITCHHVRTLERDGIVIIPNALSKEVLLTARSDVARYTHSITLETAGVGSNANRRSSVLENDAVSVRQDTVAWLRPPTTNEPMIGQSLLHCIRLIRGAAFSLNRFNYAHSYSHRVPLQCQLALYKGDGRSGYVRHLDRCDLSFEELGLLEYLRVSDFRGRVITIILYLNDASRSVEDGGALRCWLRGEETNAFEDPFDVQPTGGTMIIFHSNRLEHQVLPSTVDRYALTCWVNGELI